MAAILEQMYSVISGYVANNIYSVFKGEHDFHVKRTFTSFQIFNYLEF